MPSAGILRVPVAVGIRRYLYPERLPSIRYSNSLIVHGYPGFPCIFFARKLDAKFPLEGRSISDRSLAAMAAQAAIEAQGV